MKRLLRAVVGIALLATPLHGQQPEIHSEHFIHGHPRGVPATNDLIIRDDYALSNNDSTKFADWVAYRLRVHEVEGPDLERDWEEDPWLHPDETLEESDYTGAYDSLDVNRGHQAPLGSFRGTLSGDQSNFLSNITPQKSPLNQGEWEELESAIREVARHDTVYVMTGPLYEREMPELPQADEPHTIPSGYWKIVAVRGSDVPQVVAFVLDQEVGFGDDFCDHQVSVDAVQDRSGLDFFWKLDPDDEEELEASEGSDNLAGRFDC